MVRSPDVARNRRVSGRTPREYGGFPANCRAVLMSFLRPNVSGEDRNAPAEWADDGAKEAPSRTQDMADELHGGHHAASAPAVERAGLEPFAVDVQRRDDVAIVRPRGELDLATVETLRAALDDINGAGRLVLDLRGLSFLDCAGLHLLVALHQRAQREGFQLALLAPAAPADKPIKLLGLDRALPFAAPDDALDRQPGESSSGPAPGGKRRNVKRF